MIKFCGYDEAIIGTAWVWHPDGNRVERVVYSAEAIVHILVSQDGMTEEDAKEYIDFNVDGGYLGEATPIVVWKEHNIFQGD